jgi:hypothetical protein
MYRLQKIVDRLLREPTPQSMLDHLHRVLREVHVEHFALLKFSHPGDDVEDWLVGLRAPPKWIDAYQYRDDPSRDPVIAHSRTVEWHIDKAMKKLGARNRIQAVVLAIRDGLIAPHQ